MISLRKTLVDVSSALSAAQVSFALIGGFALAAHGIHRSTVDIDFLADGEKKETIKNALLTKGYKIRYESSEVLQFDGPGFVYIVLANRPLSQRMLKMAKSDQALNVHVLRAEDLIGLKIQAYKNDPSREFQDKADIEALILNHADLDLTQIKEYADLFGEWQLIEKMWSKR